MFRISGFSNVHVRPQFLPWEPACRPQGFRSRIQEKPDWINYENNLSAMWSRSKHERKNLCKHS